MNCLEAGARVAPAAMPDVPVHAYPMGRWTLLKNPFGKRSKPAVPAAPVQGELLLDMVRPICNDLSDSDLEIVPAAARGAAEPSREQPCPKAALAAGPGPASPTAPTPELTSELASELAPELAPGVVAGGDDRPTVSRLEPAAWEQVSDQLFGAGKS